MKGRPCKPAPDGFFEFAADNGSPQIRAKFVIGGDMVARLLKTMPEDWQQARTALMTERQKRGGGKCPEESAAIHAAKKAIWYQQNKDRFAARYAKRKEQRAAIRAAQPEKYKALKGPAQKPVPDGLFEYVLHHTYAETGARFSCSTATVHRFISKLPDDQRQQVIEAASLRKRKAGVCDMNKAKASAKAKRRASPVNWGFNKPTAVADVPGGKAQRAVDFLKRHYKPAFNAERVHGKAWAGLFVVGRERLTAEQVVARAEQHGFDLNAWRTLAA